MVFMQPPVIKFGFPRIKEHRRLVAARRNNIESILNLCNRVALPDIFQGLGQSLPLHSAVNVPGVAGENKLVMVALCRKRFGHIFVGENPIVHAIAHDVRVKKIPVADFQPDA